jgi:hypothetical protein
MAKHRQQVPLQRVLLSHGAAAQPCKMATRFYQVTVLAAPADATRSCVGSTVATRRCDGSGRYTPSLSTGCAAVEEGSHPVAVGIR